ncbi:MAG: AlwI family type II restriction endonuclease [Brevinema sp.]
MPKVWSMNTTVRNPERITDMLKVLKPLEGSEFNKETQRLHFRGQIQNKYYMPNDTPPNLKLQYEDTTPFDEDSTDIIYATTRDQDLRGRTAVAMLNKTGLAIALQAHPSVAITPLGNALLDSTISLQEFYFRFFLKWQLPNPIEDGYQDFNIQPFIALLHVINLVNQKELARQNKAKGISRNEFQLFIPSLIDYNNIEQTATNIIDYRDELAQESDKIGFFNKVLTKIAQEVFSDELKKDGDLDKKIRNLKDYTDSAIRYFRTTGLIYYRGNGYYIDIAPTRIQEVKRLLDTYTGESLEFETKEDYINYLSDINLPQLPWENKSDLIAIYNQLVDTIQAHLHHIKTHYPSYNKTYNYQHLALDTNEDIQVINQKIVILRETVKTLTNDKKIYEERNLENLSSYIDELNVLATRKKASGDKDPLKLEKFTALSLMALDDADEIKPNYSMGDDGEPLFTASGNKPDIECFYKAFNLIAEVTLLKQRDQWINEGQPVMRHLRDFEDAHPNKPSYCLFIAPVLHQDTMNTFWFSVKYEYQGRSQKIIPLTIEQYNKILKIALELNNRGTRILHTYIKNLLENISDISECTDSTQWYEHINSKLELL